MKKTLLILILFIINQVNAQIINFPDAAFKYRLVISTTTNSIAKDINGNSIKVDVNNDGEIEVSEALAVYELRTFVSFSYNIADYTGIVNFQNLKKFIITNNGVLFTLPFLDLSGLLNLEYINCNNNYLQNLNVSNLPNLKELYCYNNQLQILDLTNLPNLERIDCNNNDIISLDLSDSTNLLYLYCQYNQLVSLDISGITTLLILHCNDNYITNLDISNANELVWLRCNNNQIASLSLSNTSVLKDVNCSFNNLTTLDFSNCTVIEDINCNGNDLTSINITGLPNLNYFSCFANELTTIDFSGSDNIEKVELHSNQISEINVSNLGNLKWLWLVNNNLTTLNLNGLSQLYRLALGYNNLSSIYIKDIAYNGGIDDFLSFNDNPNLQYVCTNQSKIPLIQSLVDGYGYTNCVVDDSCTLSTNDFENKETLTLYPNPTNSILNINSINKIISVEVYTILGQLVLMQNSKNNTSIDVSILKSGNYYLKIYSDNDTTIEKFIKI